MASLKASSTRTALRGSSPRPHDHDLPEGSSLFQEVMAELHPCPYHPHPTPPDKSPNVPRRRKTTQVKHVHYVPSVTRDAPNKEERSSHHHHHQQDEEEEEEEEEEDSQAERQILHGKCHCYFVEKGNVTGLADNDCHHEHRLHPPHSPHPPGSPRPSPRRMTPSASPEGSPRSRVGGGIHPHNNHHPHAHSGSSSLHPPDADSYRGRSNSDSASLSRRTSSLSPQPYYHRKDSRPSPRRSPVPGSSPGTEKSTRRRRSSLQHDPDLSERMTFSLHVSSPPPPILIQDTAGSASDAGGGRGRRVVRKMSSGHAVDSGQLHYLYDQFLAHGDDGH